jgi:DnaK suppressor protein
MDEARARELLAAAREQTERQIATLTQDFEADSDPDQTGDPTLEQHIADFGSELFDKELEEGHLEDLRERLAAIERAEKRLEEGTYGRSVDSGTPIPDARLEALPWAERTVQEQSDWERRR